MSRKYQPLPTMPWSRGSVPVRNVACAEHVTAGVIARNGALAPSAASALRCGVSAPIRARVKPTTLRTAVGRTRASVWLGSGADGFHRQRDRHARRKAERRIQDHRTVLTEPDGAREFDDGRQVVNESDQDAVGFRSVPTVR